MRFVVVLLAVLTSGCAIGYAPGLKPTTVGRDNDNDSIVTGVRKDADLKLSYIVHEVSFIDRNDAVKNFFRESFGSDAERIEVPAEDFFPAPVRTELRLRVGTAGKLTIRRENTIRDVEIDDVNSLYFGVSARYPIWLIALSNSGDLQFGIDTGFVWDGYLLSEDVNVQGEILIGNTYNRFDAELGAGLGFRVRKSIGAEVHGAIALVNPVLNMIGGAFGDNDGLPLLDANGSLGLIWRPIPRFLTLTGGVGRGIVDGGRMYKDGRVQLGLSYTF